MDALPDDVLVHHLIPAVVWVHHWNACLHEWGTDGLRAQFEPVSYDLPRQLLDLIERPPGVVQWRYTRDKLRQMTDKEAHVEDRSEIWNIQNREADEVYEKYGVCYGCSFQWLLALRLVNRRFYNAVGQSVIARRLVALDYQISPSSLTMYEKSTTYHDLECNVNWMTGWDVCAFWHFVFQRLASRRQAKRLPRGQLGQRIGAQQGAVVPYLV